MVCRARLGKRTYEFTLHALANILADDTFDSLSPLPTYFERVCLLNIPLAAVTRGISGLRL